MPAPLPNYFVLFVKKKKALLQNLISKKYRGAHGVGVGKIDVYSQRCSPFMEVKFAPFIAVRSLETDG